MVLEILNPYAEKDIKKLRVTSCQGMRTMYNQTEPHPALDLVSDGDKRLVAIGDGKIGNAAWDNGWGNYIRLDLDTGEFAYYAHQSKFVASRGQRVRKGEIIGLEGATGRSTGSHLHLQIRSKPFPGYDLMCPDFTGIQNKIGRVAMIDYPNLIAQLTGFEKQTLDYFDTKNYKYAWDLWRKLYFFLVTSRVKNSGKDSRTFVKTVCGFSDGTMKCIDRYKFASDFYDKLANISNK